MLRNVIISPLNHIRFVPMDEVLPERYHQPQFDKAWLSEQILPDQEKVQYGQPIEKKDWLDIQFLVSQIVAGSPIVMRLTSCDRSYEAEFTMTVPLGMPNINIGGLNYFVQRLSVKNIFSLLDEGTYYLYFGVPFDTDNSGTADITDWFISEPLIVKDDHPDTVLVEYSNSFNKDNIIFEQVNQKFRKRIGGRIMDYQPKSSLVVFNDQGENPTLLSATAYRTWKFVTAPIPNYEIDKLNHAFALDGVYIEGKGYARVEGSMLEKSTEGQYALASGSIELGEVNNMNVFKYSKGGLTLIESIPAYPFEIYQTRIGYQNNYDYADYEPTRVGSGSIFNTWINFANSIISENGMEGQIVIEGNSLVYQRGETEDYDFAECRILQHRLGIKHTTEGVNTILTIIGLAGTGYPASPSSARYSVYRTQNGNSLAATGYTEGLDTLVSIQHTSSGAGVTTFDIFHDGNLGTITLNGARVSGIEKYDSNKSVPNKLETFSITNSTRLINFSIMDIFETMETLMTFNLRANPSLVNIGTLLPIITNTFTGWKKLYVIGLRENNLNTAMLDQWYNSMRQAILWNKFFVYNGVVGTGGQISSAQPSSASAVARSVLQSSYNWLVAI